MIIPLSDIAPETLNNLVEAFVLQEGTDYGEMEYDLEQKVNHVMMQLKSGQAFVQYSELHESVNIVTKEQIQN
ncbi:MULTISPECIES: YheU family protein [Alteromonadaceae]|uniref:YheU family protein n=1 Tax=Alteromonadaceae TaxID=72275 RepID=UPI001C084E1E|nr:MULTISPECIES: YheU family protein [Aliiglaciecola]MBU2877517.1 YheU family protein [Aliiglaciecola lipolytica]MDO6711097.1 YheU family protein [Aliiglaciecola sp. 2_MG-2023]MDO6752011.1 YheU family protein [Aliiglaciecola sp. 1_MG-2023]